MRQVFFIPILQTRNVTKWSGDWNKGHAFPSCIVVNISCGLSSDMKVTSVKSEPVILRITVM